MPCDEGRLAEAAIICVRRCLMVCQQSWCWRETRIAPATVAAGGKSVVLDTAMTMTMTMTIATSLRKCCDNPLATFVACFHELLHQCLLSFETLLNQVAESPYQFSGRGSRLRRLLLLSRCCWNSSPRKSLLQLLVSFVQSLMYQQVDFFWFHTDWLLHLRFCNWNTFPIQLSLMKSLRSPRKSLPALPPLMHLVICFWIFHSCFSAIRSPSSSHLEKALKE